MILFNENQSASLQDFGILIPIHDSKATKSLSMLIDHPLLGKHRQRWYVKLIPEPIDRTDLLRVHASDYVQRLYSEELEQVIITTYELIDDQGNYHRYEPSQATRPLKQMFERLLERVSGTLQCGRIALSKGFCFHFGGGMHHAHRSFGHGFCIVNDIVIAIRKLQAENLIRTAWVVDVDAHKGDGTAALTYNDPSITTLSIHMAGGWPLDGPAHDAQGQLHPWFIPSDIDIPIGAGEEADYVERLSEGLQKLAQFGRPDLAVVVCGADPYAEDVLPSTRDLRLSLDQLKQRDQLVYNFLVSRQIPAAFLMAGGYGPNSWKVYTQFLEWALPQHLGLEAISK